MKTGHIDFTVSKQEYATQLPQSQAIQIADYYKEGKTVAEIPHLVKINGNPVSLSLAKIMYEHISTIELSCMRIMQGVSSVYELVEGLEVPTTIEELKTIIHQNISAQGEQFSNVYDCTFEELYFAVDRVVDNIISAQNGGNGTWEIYVANIPTIE